VLEHEKRIGQPVAPAVVLLHGRGSNRHDLFGLTAHLPEQWSVLAPEAPFPAAQWGYGPGSAWYRFMGRNRPEPDSFRTSLAELDAFVRAIPDLLGFTPPAIAVGGFSQGGTMSIGYALTHPGVIPMVVNFSGFVADHPDVRVNADNVAGTRFFWGHGTRDPQIPFDLAVEGRAQLRDAGADLEAHDYPIGHTIAAQELADAIAFITHGARRFSLQNPG